MPSIAKRKKRGIVAQMRNSKMKQQQMQQEQPQEVAMTASKTATPVQVEQARPVDVDVDLYDSFGNLNLVDVGIVQSHSEDTYLPNEAGTGTGTKLTVHELEGDLDKKAQKKEHDKAILQFEHQALPEDIYALMSTSSMRSLGFLFAFSIFAIQMGILALVLTDLVDFSDNPVTTNGADNRLQIPADTGLQVTIAQCLGIILIVNFAVAEGDMVRGITHLVDGYDPELMLSSPEAKWYKWIFSGILQTLVGALLIMDAFILMMKSKIVIEMCLNFAALSFVQDFDDAAFALGAMGLLSRRIQVDCLRVGHIQVKAENRNKTNYVRRAILVLMTIGLSVTYAIITSWKWSGMFMCDSLYVQFGDAYGPEWPYYSGQFDSLGNSIGDRQNGRMVYVDSTQTLQLAFCTSIPAWTFSNRTDVGDDYCDYLIRSSETTSYDIIDVATETWFARTSSVGDVPMDWMAVVCADCSEALCEPGYGECINNRCECYDGFLGLNCEFEVPDCKFLGLDLRSKSSLPALPFASLFVDNEYVKLEDDLGLADQFYGRPIYASYNREGNLDTLILFTGRRWVMMGTPQEEVASVTWDTFYQNLIANDVVRRPLDNLLNISRTFTSLTPFFFSDPVDYGTESHQVDPTQVKWVLAKADESLPLLGSRGDDTFDVSAKFICSHCNDTTNQCLNGGACNATTTYCDCPESYGGFVCEYSYNCGERGCSNGGTCDEVYNICRDCDPLYYGNLCQFKRLVVDASGNIDFDAQAALLGDDFFLCVNGTTCNNGGWCTSNVTACSCLPDFTGDYCEILRENSTLIIEDGFICANSSCINDGYCVGNATECTCPEPYTGTLCEQQFGNDTLTESFFHCNNATCLNDGYCQSPSDPCVCVSGFTGDFCESSSTLIEGHDLCSNSTCLNGGYCRNIVEVCYCPEGYEGIYCEVGVNNTVAPDNFTEIEIVPADFEGTGENITGDNITATEIGGNYTETELGENYTTTQLGGLLTAAELGGNEPLGNDPDVVARAGDDPPGSKDDPDVDNPYWNPYWNK